MRCIRRYPIECLVMKFIPHQQIYSGSLMRQQPSLRDSHLYRDPMDSKSAMFECALIDNGAANNT